MTRAEKLFASQGHHRESGRRESISGAEAEEEEEEGVRGRKTRRKRSRQEWRRRPETASRYFIRGTSQITAGTPSLYVQPPPSFATPSYSLPPRHPFSALFFVLSTTLYEPHWRESSARNRLAFVLKYYPPPPPYTRRYTHFGESAHPEESGTANSQRDTTSSNPRRDYVPPKRRRALNVRDKFYPRSASCLRMDQIDQIDKF